jgi:hypothetical protein
LSVFPARRRYNLIPVTIGCLLVTDYCSIQLWPDLRMHPIILEARLCRFVPLLQNVELLLKLAIVWHWPVP